VEIESLAGLIEIQPSLGINVSAEHNSRSQSRIRFTQRPAWGKPYTLIIRKGIDAIGGGETMEDLTFLLCFDTAEFMPPQFLQGFFKKGTEYQVLSKETDFDTVILDVVDFPTTGIPVSTELCLVFTVSQEASALSAASAMEALSISTFNGCAYISIKKLRVLEEADYRTSGFNDPGLNGGMGKKLCALVYGLEVENTGRDGLIVFSIRSSLLDLLGNSLEENLSFTWNKK
jgi:hypothetical protein